MKAVIMAGGEGTRLRPLTCLLPKPLTPIAGVPTITHIINLLKKHGITDIAMTLQYMPGLVTGLFGTGESMEVDLQYYIENSPLGTAGSVKNTGEFIESPFIVISGDGITDIDLTSAIEFHNKNKSAVTIVLKKVDNPLEYGVVVTDSGGKIIRFLEKPSWSEVCSDTVNTGIYIIQPEVMEYVPEGKVFDFSKDLFPLLMKEKIPIYGYTAEGYWCDIGDIHAYHSCQNDVLNKKVLIQMESREIESGIWVGKNTVIESGVMLSSPLYIGSDCYIHEGSVLGANTVIGNGCIIENNVNITESVIWEYSHIMTGTLIEGSIICDRVVIHPNCRLCNNSVIGSNTIIMNGAVLNDGVKIWNDKFIEEDSEIYENLIRSDKAGKVAFGEKGISSGINSELRPETMLRLGAVFATLCGNGSKIGVSSNGSNSAVMGKLAIMTGIMLTGCQCIDFGPQPIPITRSGIKFYSLSGGIHISSDEKTGNLQIDFINKNGANITKDTERKIENLFSRGEYIREDEKHLKEIVSLHSYKFYYLRDIVNKCKNSKLPFTLLLNVKNALIQGLLKSVLDDLGCSYKFKSQTIDIENEKDVRQFANEVESEDYDMGVYIDGYGEKLVLFDQNGTRLSDDMMLCLSALIQFKTKPSIAYVARVSSPSVIEVMADKLRGTVIRTKSSPINVMAELTQEGRDTAISAQFVIEFDAIGGIVKILDFMKSNEISLNTLTEEIPKFYMATHETHCEPKDKGLLIKMIATQNANKKMEFTEGVKIYEKGGWILLLPHSHKPTCRVICEGYTEEFAQELIAEYKDKIDNILKK